MKLDVAHVTAPKVGEIENGDRFVFRTDVADRALIAVIDGLGHGPEAARASQTAAEFLNDVSLESELTEIMERLHRKMSGTRGAAGTICILRDGIARACAVGNVELRSADVRLPLVFSAGILGVRVAKFHVCVAPLDVRCRLVLFSDGISSRTPLEDFRRLKPAQACEAVMQKHRRKEDDATIGVLDLG
jgi:negative regulator of sigma-B (phosphoserine phosphatase)